MTMSAASYRSLYLPFDSKRLQPIIIVRERPNPRFYFADEAVRADFVQALTRGGLSPRVAFVSGPVGIAPGVVRRARETSSSAMIDVEASGDALLVCSITRHKYWRATLDGRPATIVPVNIAFQAVPVPAGRHQIRLEYRNPLVAAGGVISLVTAAAAIAAVILRRRGTSRPAAGADSSP